MNGKKSYKIKCVKYMNPNIVDANQNNIQRRQT